MTQEENIRAYRVRSPGGLLYKMRQRMPGCLTLAMRTYPPKRGDNVMSGPE
jgi:hypothetical protein